MAIGFSVPSSKPDETRSFIETTRPTQTLSRSRSLFTSAALMQKGEPLEEKTPKKTLSPLEQLRQKTNDKIHVEKQLILDLARLAFPGKSMSIQELESRKVALEYLKNEYIKLENEITNTDNKLFNSPSLDSDTDTDTDVDIEED